MRTAKIVAVLIIQLLLIQSSPAQEMAVDTSLANNYLSKANKFKTNSQYDSAIVYFKDAGSLYRTHNQWRKFLQCERERSGCFNEKMDYEHSILTIDSALQIVLPKIGESDSLVAEAYHSIGFAYYGLSDYDKTIYYWEKAKTIRLAVLGEKSYDAAKSYYNLANIYTIKDEHDNALESYKTAYKIIREVFGDNDPQVADIYHNMGVVYSSKGMYDLALEYYLEALRIIKLNGDKDLSLAAGYLNIGNIYAYKDDNKQSLEYYLKALEMYKELHGEIHLDVAMCYNNIGRIYYFMDEYSEAIEYYQKALKIQKSIHGDKHLDVATVYSNIGDMYDLRNELKPALDYHNKALQIRNDLLGEKHSLVAVSYNDIGDIYYQQNEYNIALEYYNKALTIQTEVLGRSHIELASTYANIGSIYNFMDQYDLALEYYTYALDIEKTVHGEIHSSVALTYRYIGSVYNSKNEYDLALQYYFKALQISTETLGEESISVANNYNNIGNAYKSIMKYDLALEYHFKALQIYMKLLGEENISVAMSYNNLGIVYRRMEDYKQALDYHLKALKIKKATRGDTHTSVATSYDNIGVVYEHMDDYDRALEYYYKGLDIRREVLGIKHSLVAKSYNNIGIIYKKKKDYTKALHYSHKAAVCNLLNYNDTINTRAVPVIRDYLDWSVLFTSLQRKISILEEHGDEIKNLNETEGLILALHHYMACDTLINRVRQSITSKSDKLALGEKANTTNNGAIEVCERLSQLVSPKRAQYYNELAFYFSEKNKASILLEALAGIEAKKFAGIPESLLERESKLKSDISLYEKLIAEKSDSISININRNKLFGENRKLDELNEVFENQYPEYFELKYNTRLPDIKSIQGLLDDETALISYSKGKDLITVFTITKENFRIGSISSTDFGSDEIEAFRKSLHGIHNIELAERYKETAYNMFCQLIPENLDPGISNLVIIPDAELSAVPFETLLTDNTPQKDWAELPYLVKKYNISYSYSANLFYKTQTQNQSGEIEHTYIGDWIGIAPVFDDANTAGLSIRSQELLSRFDTELRLSTDTRGRLLDGRYVNSLPGSETEIKKIFFEFNLYGKKALMLMNDNANEEFIKQGGLRNYKYLHFASHGFVNTEKPELSGILMAQDSLSAEDGILYSGEIYNLNLNADLTVLSACETGLGKISKGEGLLGLTRALLYAGSKNIIVSLWKVADESTTDLMINFYRNMLETENENKGYSQALRQAKLEMIDQGTYAHPFYWSPFILIGK